MGKMKMVVSWCRALELNVQAFHSSVSLQRRAVSHPSGVSSFRQNPVFTPPVSNFFLISGAWLSFRTPNFRDSCVVHLTCSSRGGSCCTFVVCQSIQVCSHTTTLWFVVYSKIAESQYNDWLSRIPLSYFWEQCSMLASPVLLVTQGILRPHCHYWDSGQLPHLSTFKWTSKGSDFALCWLQYFAVAPVNRAPSLPLYPQLYLPQVNPPPGQSKGGHFSTWRFAVFVLSDLWLMLWVFIMIW